MTKARGGWYVINVDVGREDAMASLLSRVLIAEDVEEVFFPQFEVEAKFRGEWKRALKPLWPGYIVAASRSRETLAKGCDGLSERVRIVEVGGHPGELISPATELLRRWTEQGNRVVPVSTAVKEGEGITVLDGPLMHSEHLIKSVDRRKGIAVLDIAGIEEHRRMRVGLRILPSEKLWRAKLHEG